jgi:NADH:ubiquinone oxidoreductase subunit 5 (subunit L)/multisubunit Na+/H+ antiporter MnhA subunit
MIVAIDAPFAIFAPLLLIVVGVVLMPIAGKLPRTLLALLFLSTWSLATASLIDLARVLLAAGRWDLVVENGWVGATARVLEPFPLSVDPLRLLFVASIHLSGGLALVGARQAWGGGVRRVQTPASAGQRVTALVLLGVTELAVIVDRLDHLVMLAALGAGLSGLLLFASKARPEGVHGVAWLFALHRIGDVALVVTVVVLAASGLPLGEGALAVALADLDVVHVVRAGPLTGFPWRIVIDLVAALLAVFTAMRLLVFPFSSVIKSVVEGPAPVLLFAHGIGGAALALVVLVKFAVVLHHAPAVVTVFALVLVVAAVVQLLTALSITDLTEIDVRMMFATAALTALALVLGAIAGAVLGFALLLIVVVAAVLADGAAIEAMQGTSDVMRMGGLWRPLRRTDAVRALATFSLIGFPGLTGFIFYDALLGAALSSTRGGVLLFVGAFVAVGLAGFVALRSLHLVFVGDKPRGAAPALLVEPSRERWGILLVVVLGISGLSLFFATPQHVLDRVMPGAFSPLDVLLAPSAFVHVYALYKGGGEPPFVDGMPALLPVLLVTGVAVAVYALSYVLYRRRHLAPGLRSMSPTLLRVRGFLANDLSAMHAIARFIQNPILDLARAVARIARPVLVDGLLEQAPRAAAAVIAVTARLLHAGDIQRALLIVIITISVVLTLWGQP